jgi:thiosulfate/3-mercaptopyruvate sulfurtransferase
VRGAPVDRVWLASRLQRVLVLDSRPLAAYNGWRAAGEARGGHIPGAAALPGSWLESVDDESLEALLRSKGVEAGQTVVLSDPGDRSVRDRLEASLGALGVAEVRRLEGGYAAWSADPGLPRARLPRYQHLVHPAWVGRLGSGRAPSKIFEVGTGTADRYREGHIPGAWFLDTDQIESGVDWNRRPDLELVELLKKMGITTTTTVVLYGQDGDDRHGQLGAFRAAHILYYCGVEQVRILDGGLGAWLRSGSRLESGSRTKTPVARLELEVPGRPQVMIDLEGARAILSDRGGSALVSVRTRDEQVGKVSGYDYVGPRGRIPGDVWGGGGSDAHHVEHLQSPDGTMRPYPEIEANWARAGITREKRVAFYCGTGWRASAAWFAAYLMGWDQIAVYDGGWLEWSRDPHNPVETGPLTAGLPGPGQPA